MAKSKTTKDTVPPRQKVGRNWYVVDRQGKIVEGLAYDTGNGYFFYSAWRNESAVKQKKRTRKDYQFGRDYDEAVYSFKQWMAKDKTYSTVPAKSIKETGVGINTPEDAPEGAEIVEEVNEDGGTEAFAVTRQIDDDEIWARARRLILQDIKTAANKLEIPALLEIEGKLLAYKDIPNLTLSDIFKFYWDYTPNKRQEKRLIRKAMEDFKKHVKDESISKIDEYDVISFNDFLHAKPSSNFINKRIERVITCLNFYIKNYKKKKFAENVHKGQIAIIVDLVHEHTDKVKEEIADTPKTFDVNTLKKIFQYLKNDKEFTLINLLGLNCGFTAIDIENLEKDMIREKDGITYISYPRLKTQKTSARIVLLWDKTVKLLREYMSAHPNETKYIFLNSAKTNLKTDKIQARFRVLKKKIRHTDGSEINYKYYKDTVASSLAYKLKNSNYLTMTIGHDFTNKKKVYWKYIATEPAQLLPVRQILYDKFKSVIDSI